MLRKLFTVVSILLLWLTPAWAGDSVKAPQATPAPDHEDMEIISMMEILQNMDLVEAMDVLQDLDILTKEKPDDTQD